MSLSKFKTIDLGDDEKAALSISISCSLIYSLKSDLFNNKVLSKFLLKFILIEFSERVKDEIYFV